MERRKEEEEVGEVVVVADHEIDLAAGLSAGLGVSQNSHFLQKSLCAHVDLKHLNRK